MEAQIESGGKIDKVKLGRKTYLEFYDETGNRIFNGTFEDGRIEISGTYGQTIVIKPRVANSVYIELDKE